MPPTKPLAHNPVPHGDIASIARFSKAGVIGAVSSAWHNAFMDHTTEQRIIQALQPFEGVRLIVVFGSVASGQQRPGSDLDVGILAARALSSKQKMAMNNALALAFNRPIDLIDLRTAGQPLLSEIIASGRPIHDADDEWGNLIYRNIMENEDFTPLQQRILREKRQAWLNS